MKLIIFADSHDRISGMEDAVYYEKPDAIFHLGDCERDADRLHRLFPDIPLYSVPGNCDISPREPYRKIIELGGHTIFMNHGHTYYVKASGYDSIINNACAAGADILMFGHTHRPYFDEFNGLTIINPGSVGYEGTYGVLEMKGKALSYRLKAVRDIPL